MSVPRRLWSWLRCELFCPRGHHRWASHKPQTITALGTYDAACRDCGDVRWSA